MQSGQASPTTPQLAQVLPVQAPYILPLPFPHLVPLPVLEGIVARGLYHLFKQTRYCKIQCFLRGTPFSYGFVFKLRSPPCTRQRTDTECTVRADSNISSPLTHMVPVMSPNSEKMMLTFCPHVTAPGQHSSHYCRHGHILYRKRCQYSQRRT